MTYDLTWNRTRLTWSKRSEQAPWQLEAILLERVLLEGRRQLRIVGKLRRLSPRDIWQVEIMPAWRIPKPQNRMPPQPSERPSANPVTGPHQPLQKMLRAR